MFIPVPILSSGSDWIRIITLIFVHFCKFKCLPVLTTFLSCVWQRAENSAASQEEESPGADQEDEDARQRQEGQEISTQGKSRSDQHIGTVFPYVY